ncbi:unnamed protein product [Clonostachys rhizophaga]|uniref:SPX domain-containing protein n=1 Tax=Clonostachys rhizophaga TaxID=160324 RepID=A0A9N9VWZ7_9HYPO|nr:unnamed protein product [Clonostachys rhizophaga]
MRFGSTLRQSIYAPWKEKYIDYSKLKGLLREDRHDKDNKPWTEDDENRFCDEIFNVQLEKVAQFQQQKFDALKQRVDGLFEKLKELAPVAGDNAASAGISSSRLKDLEAELDEILKEVMELKKFSNVNYTGFLKIIKKHDRKRGDRYRVRPMMQLSLSQRPFNSEQGYESLLNKMSLMYFAIRQQLEEHEPIPKGLDTQGETHNGERYTAQKFWVHPDNLLEVKASILRHLPALIYSEQASRELDSNDSPATTSLYFDNQDFELYKEKVDRQSAPSSLRLRWYGQLSQRPEILMELKKINANGTSEESKFSIKSKWVKPFLDGEYEMEKTVQKMERQGIPESEIEDFKTTVGKMRGFLQEKKLSPVLRANYVRTAFQRPADDRIRISLDSDLAFIREDTLDRDRPCRNPDDWHRTDIDDSNMGYPFKNINQSEVNKFPYAVLEIKLKDNGFKKQPVWIDDLVSSHLVHPVPRFSKFVHGVASLFEDYVNTLPFWLGDLETDIRKDPEKTFEEEEQRRAQRADDAMAVGSLMGGKSGSYKAGKSSPIAKSYLAERAAADKRQSMQSVQSVAKSKRSSFQPTIDEVGESSFSNQQQGYGTLSSVVPSFSLSKYAKSQRLREAQLPEGVVEPAEWIKNAGELKIEPKVWLANERTFLKWQHICILQGTVALALYTAAGEDLVAEVMGVVYILIAAFAGAWGYWMLHTRRIMIMERSGKDFDNMVGPIVISIALMVALIINFFFAYQKAFDRSHGGHSNQTIAIVDELL